MKKSFLTPLFRVSPHALNEERVSRGEADMFDSDKSDSDMVDSGNRIGRRDFLKSMLRHSALGVTVLTSGSLLSACSSQITQHGHLLTDADLQQVQPGMSKQQVKFLLGTPDTVATYTGDVFYYISSKMESKAFLKPKEIDRRVVAVYFAPQIDTVARVAHYGLQDGKVIDFISRETPSHGKEANLLQQLFRNLGPSTSIFGN